MRHRTPRAKRSSARGWLGRLPGGPWARRFISRVFLGSFAFVFYEGKRVFPICLGDPYGCPRQRRSARHLNFSYFNDICAFRGR
jgi:hypothetical protein